MASRNLSFKAKNSSLKLKLFKNKKLIYASFSKSALAIFILAFASIGSYLLHQSHAATAPYWVGTFTGPGGCADPKLYPYINPPVGYSTGGSVNQCVPDPNGSGQTVLQMTVTPSTCAWSCEQREDWDSPQFMPFNTGGIGSTSDWYVSIPIMIPTSQGLIGGNGWGVQFNEQFGQPTNGSPTNSLTFTQVNNRLVYNFGGNSSGSTGGGSNKWDDSVPANDGKWHDFIEHIVFSTSATTGEIQIWKDGNPITFNACSSTSVLSGCGTTTLHFPTVVSGTSGSNQWVQINNYRNNSPSNYTSTVYHGVPAAGPTYDSVANTYNLGGSGSIPIPGDLNGDGHVNIFDLSIFLNHWQQTGTGIPEDFNNDQVVNIFDLSILLSHYGT